MRGAGRRRGKESFTQDHWAPPPPDHRHFTSSRDSDASYCSSRPSSVGISRSVDPINDRSYQHSAIRTINNYLSLHSCNFSLKPPLPSAKDITETLRFIMSHLDFPTEKLEEGLPILLKHLNCPIKFNKSTLRAPGTPHTWPSLLAVMHWLVQMARYNDDISSSNTTLFKDNSMSKYALNSYLHFIQGDDDSVDAIDGEFLEKFQKEKESLTGDVLLLAKEVEDLEAKVARLGSEPSAREALEKNKAILEEDAKKFNAMIAEFSRHTAKAEEVLEQKEKELEAKMQENKNICEENEELKKMIDLQTINARDAERMKRELQSVEREIAEAEAARTAWEEKSYDLDKTLRDQFKELEALSIECNQAIRRLKLGNDFLYVLNANGTSPAEILGIDYKEKLKPTLNSIADGIKRSKMEKLDELVSLQQQSAETATKIEGKKKRIDFLQSHIDEVTTQMNFLRKQTQDSISKCAIEAKRMIQDVEAESHNLSILEREAAEMLKASQLNLQGAIRQSEEEIQLCAHELLALVDSVSKHKEYMASQILEMKSALIETAGAVSDAFKGSLEAEYGMVFSANH